MRLAIARRRNPVGGAKSVAGGRPVSSATGAPQTRRLAASENTLAYSWRHPHGREGVGEWGEGRAVPVRRTARHLTLAVSVKNAHS